jgi:hypothetical protein
MLVSQDVSVVSSLIPLVAGRDRDETARIGIGKVMVAAPAESNGLGSEEVKYLISYAGKPGLCSRVALVTFIVRRSERLGTGHCVACLYGVHGGADPKKGRPLTRPSAKHARAQA